MATDPIPIADRLRALSTMGGQAAVSTLLQDAAAEIERLQAIVAACPHPMLCRQIAEIPTDVGTVCMPDRRVETG